MDNAAFDLFLEDDETAQAAELTQKSLIDTQERMGMMLDLMPMGLLIHTQQGIIFANQEACRQLHIGQAEAIGHHFLDFVDPKEVPAIMALIDRSFVDDTMMHARETKISHKDGDLFIKLISCRLPWQGNPVVQILLQDVTDLKHTEQKLRRMAITDELTGAFNRRHAFYEAALYVDPDRDPRIPLSAILADIDHFKRVNDTYGHHAGDLALVAVANVANRLIRTENDGDSAMFARIGGEEFLILLPGLEEKAAMAVAERFRKAVEQQRVVTPAGTLNFTISMGVASFRESDKTFEALLSRCDSALYVAKAAGRNRAILAE
jgi:diguanylate cyclase (GGDEF)-like protein/PAS domain S-box-containing protein